MSPDVVAPVQDASCSVCVCARFSAICCGLQGLHALCRLSMSCLLTQQQDGLVQL